MSKAQLTPKHGKQIAQSHTSTIQYEKNYIYIYILHIHIHICIYINIYILQLTSVMNLSILNISEASEIASEILLLILFQCANEHIAKSREHVALGVFH